MRYGMRHRLERRLSVRILLAEDNEANRILARSLLEREGHILDFAENGLMALMCCESKKYDLILMDILMPVMDGVKTLRKLRRSKTLNAQTPVFALTAYSSQGDRRRYRQVGFDLVLSKPLRLNELMQAWNKYLKGDIKIAPIESNTPLQNFEDIPLLEVERLSQLLSSATPNQVNFITEQFWASSRRFISQIHDSLILAIQGENQALSTLRIAAHGIKGSAANIGLMRISRIAASLQNAPPDRIRHLVLSLTETIKPSAQELEQKIPEESQSPNIDSSEAHFGDANAQITPIQIPSLPLKSQSPHKILAAEAPRPLAQVP